MKHHLIEAIAPLLAEEQGIQQVYFADNQRPAPELAYQVNFPRLELIVSGEQEMEWEGTQGGQQRRLMQPGEVLFVPAGGWNSPQWQAPVTTLSLLFGKQQLGFSMLSWDGVAFHPRSKENVPRRGPRVGSFLLQALNELAWHQRDQSTAAFIVKGLFSHALDLLNSSAQTAHKQPDRPPNHPLSQGYPGG